MVSSGLFFIPSTFFKNEKVDDTRARAAEEIKSLLTQQDQASTALHQLPQGFPGVRRETLWPASSKKGLHQAYTATQSLNAKCLLEMKRPFNWN